ncbi:MULTISPECIES: substrate-binding domain-containing protein [Paraburkholderia]|uniref:Substrate-binding domain-containing protein n=1 Tax=Paraburkholderia madseniana TaxID=2599607 RepID=A0AAP5BKB9_9BURK|nr:MULTISPECIES: substrate-binding domain-containing protein [Paraburkholderia]MCX4151393.1 substrate-binding domain-containing protein [Paraburkholderia madseniana]MDN7154324.1 substrate-binding domain-containing protein [Paraburkholderia sp. WS6]MDQ6413206.1 substrate-binding domain-containing protein [Paraburkholderia madseniana]
MRGLLVAWVCACVLSVATAQGLPTAPVPGTTVAAKDYLAGAKRVVDAAAQPAAPWNGPRNGPRAQLGKRVAIVAEDLRNGGIVGVVDGVLEAAKVIGWSVKIFDSGGTPDLRLKMLANALASRPDGLIIVGGDARALLPGLRPFAERSIPIVGWHVAAQAGPVPGTPVAMNVATDPLEVARVTSLAAIVQSGGHAAVVIFTDSNFRIAQGKADEMAAVVRACSGCTLLEVRDVAISRSHELMPGTTRALLARYGKRWTYALAVNDIYFDYAAPVLTQAEMPNTAMAMLSAGDGSESAFLRIQTGSFQTATVAEPVNLHGWQLVDEMNRLFAGGGVTDYVFPVHLVTADNIAADGGNRLLYDPANGYRDVYRRIWQRP